MNLNIKKYFFLRLFFIAALVYGYFNIVNNEDGLFIAKIFLVPSLLVHYLVTSEKKNVIYVLALIFASIGDLLLGNIYLTNEVIGVGCFICFNLLMIIIVSEKIGVIKGNKLILAFTPLLFIVVAIIYLLFDTYVGEIRTLLIIYYVIFAMLCSFSLYYYICRKTKESLFFFLGTVLFFLSSIAKGFEVFRSADVLMKIINISFYVLAHYLFYKTVSINNVKKVF